MFVYVCDLLSEGSVHKIKEENFCRADKVTDRSKCDLVGSRLLAIGHVSRENSD